MWGRPLAVVIKILLLIPYLMGARSSPRISALTIIRSALTRSDAIIKTPSNDPFTAAAIVQTMHDIAPNHPVTRHISVAYWKGGDRDIEQRLYHPANIEKILAWGGLASVRHVTRYIQPGLELVSLDPKRSCSIIGPPAFGDEKAMADAAHRVAIDIGQLNQVGCVNARVVYLLCGTDARGLAVADRFAKLAYDAMCSLPARLSTKPKTFDNELRSELEAARLQDEWYHVIGGDDDEGAVVVSQLPEPVEFAASLNCRVANFVPVDSIADVTRFMDAYTQTVGIYPEQLKDSVRDVLPLSGVQRLVSLGFACAATFETAQDGIEPVRRMLKWIIDEDASRCALVDAETATTGPLP